jgi:hypothetical protein
MGYFALRNADQEAFARQFQFTLSQRNLLFGDGNLFRSGQRVQDGKPSVSA